MTTELNTFTEETQEFVSVAQPTAVNSITPMFSDLSPQGAKKNPASNSGISGNSGSGAPTRKHDGQFAAARPWRFQPANPATPKAGRRESGLGPFPISYAREWPSPCLRRRISPTQNSSPSSCSTRLSAAISARSPPCSTESRAGRAWRLPRPRVPQVWSIPKNGLGFATPSATCWNHFLRSRPPS